MKNYYLNDLHKHVEEECPLTRTCLYCSIEFDTLDSFHTHLRYTCENVDVHCSKCNQIMQRKNFFNF